MSDSEKHLDLLKLVKVSCCFTFYMIVLNLYNFIHGVKRTKFAMSRKRLRDTPFRVANIKFDERQ